MMPIAVVEEPPVAADHDRVARDAADAVDHGLDIVLQIARLTEDGRLLAQARCSGPLPGDRPGRNRLNGHGRLLVRSSGTEPVIRVMGEGDDRILVEDVVDHIVNALGHAEAA